MNEACIYALWHSDVCDSEFRDALNTRLPNTANKPQQPNESRRESYRLSWPLFFHYLEIFSGKL
ncbi:hypothetical protein N7486_004072 [Penicillium sp. IBT 16267x]|nr:hypothetical protein N7486_004072 [Penicillium sp. IBT 16267x]